MTQAALRLGWTGAIVLALSVSPGCQQADREMRVLRVDPGFGGMQGGQSIKIIGRNFPLDIGYAVYFGKKPSPQVSIANSSTLLAVSPRADTAGLVDVTIRADHGPAFRITRAFDYVNQGGTLLQ